MTRLGIRKSQAVALTLLACSCGFAAATAAGQAGRGTAASPQKHVMAEKTDGGFRVVITALRQPRADAGTVYVTAYQRHGGGWEASGSTLIAGKGAFSWSAVGMTGAVRRFSVREQDRSTTFELRISPRGWLVEPVRLSPQSRAARRRRRALRVRSPELSHSEPVRTSGLSRAYGLLGQHTPGVLCEIPLDRHEVSAHRVPSPVRISVGDRRENALVLGQ